MCGVRGENRLRTLWMDQLIFDGPSAHINNDILYRYLHKL